MTNLIEDVILILMSVLALLESYIITKQSKIIKNLKNKEIKNKKQNI